MLAGTVDKALEGKGGGGSTKKSKEKTYLNFILMARINYNLDVIY